VIQLLLLLLLMMMTMMMMIQEPTDAGVLVQPLQRRRLSPLIITNDVINDVI